APGTLRPIPDAPLRGSVPGRPCGKPAGNGQRGRWGRSGRSFAPLSIDCSRTAEEDDAVTAAVLLTELQAFGAQATVEGDRLHIAHQGDLPDALLGRLRKHKAELLAYLSRPVWRFGDDGMPQRLPPNRTPPPEARYWCREGDASWLPGQALPLRG